MVVCKDDMGAAYVAGTSFAAPWISRKLAYLIHIMGLSREVAKALLIDAASGWNRRDDISHRIGYGVVPKHINEVLKTPNDEIRFIMTGASEEYETYTYNLPVPVVDHAHPFYARATLAYFPQCDRKQGVDYTSTEMDIQFGRVVAKRGSTMIKAIDDNRQSEEKQITLYEEDARKMYRKWDNVKHISEKIKEKRKIKVAVYLKEESKRLPVIIPLILDNLKKSLKLKGFELEINYFGNALPICINNGIECGKLSKKQLHELYCECDFGMVASLTNISLVPYEMIAAGLPVIEFKDGTFDYFFSKETAILCDLSYKHLEKEILYYVENPAELEEMTIRANKSILSLSWEKSANQFVEILDHVDTVE